MLLAIDSGNTNVVFALMDGRTVLAQWRIETNDRRTADEYFVWLSQLAALHAHDLSAVSGVIIANVRPASSFALERLAKAHLDCVPLVVGKGTCQVDLEVKLPRPEQIGADRLVNAFAAKRRYGGPAILIDTGTATTFDILDESGAYVGGIIAPGVHVSAQALALAAAQLPLVPVEKPTSLIGTDTRSAVKSGLFWGYVALLEGLIDRLRTDMRAQGLARQKDIRLIATGGLMKILSQGMTGLDQITPDLTLEGLAMIFEEMTSKSQPLTERKA